MLNAIDSGIVRAAFRNIPRVFTFGQKLASLLLISALAFVSSETAAASRKPANTVDRYASVVVDAASGEVLQASNPDKQLYPASLTKMMTLHLVFDELERGRLRLDQRVPVSRHAAAQAPSKLGLRAGETISVEEVILALVTKSANDAAVVAAEAVGGSEAQFAMMMTNRAREIGMKGTTFRNASGLPNKAQVTTARDMATLARSLIRRHAHHYRYFATERFTFRDQVVTSHNRLLSRYEGADGIKTGYINASGFNLVASAQRDGRRLIGVVFGGKTAGARDRRMVELLDAGFQGKAGKPAEVLTAALPAAEESGDGDAQIVGSGDAEDASWAIQIGAFSQRKSAATAAEHTASSLVPLLADAEATVVPHKTGTGTLYRARLLGLTEDTARDACKRLLAKKKSCQILSPKDEVRTVSRR